MPELTPELIVDGLVPEDPRVSPDGQWVAFTVGPVGKADEHPTSAIWLAPVDASAPARKLTAGTANDRAPRWSPDGRWLYFASDRLERGKAQIHRIALDGGEAEPLTGWAGGIAGFIPLHDNRRLAFMAKDEPTAEDDRREHERDDARVWGERVPYARLRILDLDTRAINTIDVLGDRHVAEVAPRPDGGPLAVFTWSLPDADPGSLDTQIHLIDLEAATSDHLVTLPNLGDDLTWKETTDGWELWYVAQTPPNSTGAVTLFAVTVPSGGMTLGSLPATPRNLTPDLPACVGGIVAGSGPQPLLTIFHGLDSSFARWDDEKQAPVTLFESPGTIQGTSIDRDRSVVALVRSGAAEPADIWTGRVDGSEPLRRVSDTRPELREIPWGRQERLAWQAADGLNIEGFLVLPPGKTRADGPFPTITLPHGGPYSRYADDFQLRTSPSAQWLAHAGYAVFLPNPRGGMGRGHAFSSTVAGAVGLDDWGDICTGLDILVAEGVADADRLGIGGWSQGGYMTAWAVGQTDRFKAGVMGAGVSDWGMMVATSDLPHFEADLGGSAGWEGIGPHQHDAISPISFAHRVKTPVLILHGEADERVPLSQAEFYARALREHGVPFEYVVYPREPHGVRERNHQIDLLRRTRAWFDRWLGGDGEGGRMRTLELGAMNRAPTAIRPTAAIDRGAYLDRIEYGGTVTPTLEALAGIVLAQLRAVPFENLDIVPLGRPLRLDPEGLFAKIVGERRGGYCFELNGLLALVLEDLGFTAVRVACQFTEEGGYSDPFDHLALIVTVPGAGEWFVDVGSGRTSPAAPLEMPGPDAWGAPGPPDPADGRLTRIERRGDAGYIWHLEPGGTWKEHQRFGLSPRTLDDFLSRSRVFETDPDNHFRQGPMCTRLTANGRVSIRPGMLTITADGERTETPLVDDSALQAALMTHFGIDLSRFAPGRGPAR